MVSEFIFALPTQIGNLMIEFNQQKLTSLVIGGNALTKNQIIMSTADADNEISGMLLIQLEKYFASASLFKTIPFAADGTEFQKSVWSELRKIPLGETRTYGDIAKKLNSSARAVGNACRKNPIQIIIPCHRVISAKGIGGYAGETDGKQLNTKRWLLAHEGVVL